MSFTLRKYQEEVIQQLLDNNGVGLIALPLSAGKTLVAVEVLKRMKARRIVVTAPLNTHNGWERHFKLIMPELPVYYIDKKNEAASFATLEGNELGVFIIGWEYGRGSYRYDRDQYGNKTGKKTVIREQLDWSKYDIDAYVADEVQRGANRKSLQAQVMHTAKRAPIKLALSATPAGSKIEGIWSILHTLWPNKYKHFWPWVNSFLKTERDPNPHVKFQIAGEKRPGIVARDIPVYARRAEEEVHGDLPPIVVHDVPVQLSPKQRKIYDQFEKDALAWLDNNPVAAALPITKDIRLKQVCLAQPTLNDEEEVDFALDAKSSKIDMLMDIIKDLPGEKVLVWTHSRKIIPVVLDRLQRNGISAAPVYGGQSKDARNQVLDGFKEGNTEVIVASISALNEGVDGLQHVCAVEVWLSKAGVIANRQAEGRLQRIGQKKTVTRYVIRAVNTVETRQLGRLRNAQEGLEAAQVM